ncbi:MAG: hypothetical protein JO227_05385 [Acetobacteraceae bacterium]|nr:hypothetical protein [Acetobacteraceae bacterium]
MNQAFAQNTSLTAAGMQASVNSSGKLVVSSNNGTMFQLTAVGVANNDIGCGTTGTTFHGNDSSIAPMTSPALISAGSQQTSQLAFTGMAYGSDAQQITVSANDSNGNQQAVNITLSNNSTTRNAQNIDDAVNAINTALQKTDNAALQGIVAVKTDTNGAEGITFTSTNTSFNVSVGKTANGTGFTTSGTVASSTVGTGNTADISNQLGAQNAVNALATAVQNLGTAQAAVGKGENLLNYAVSLATSQVTNEAASESQIRDANLAQEAANLSRAQILVQAGTAALAQANSAPQQLLSLLQH